MINIFEQDTLLNSVRILDLCQYLPGPYATLKMLELGAEVIKVEPPAGEPMRSLGIDSKGISPLYRHLNQGKKIVEMDLKTGSGRAYLAKLVSDADVLVEGFRPGTLKRMGYSNQVLHDINPALIICSVSGFGQGGENAQRAGHDLGYAARSGLYTQHAEHEKPQIMFPPVADHAASLSALAMVCAALFRREKTGLGSVLDVSINDTVADWQYMLESESVAGKLSGETACYNIYQTADGRFVSLAALELKFWSAFCTSVSRPDWIGRHAEALPQLDLIIEISALFKAYPLAYWQKQLREVDCCFEAVISHQELPVTEEADLQWVEAKDIHWSSK